MFEREVLPRLDPVDRAVLGQVASAWRALVVAGPGRCCHVVGCRSRCDQETS